MSLRRLVIICLFVAFAVSAFAQSDLYITKDAPAQVIAGTHFTYVINFGNAGPDDDGTVTISDTLPAGLTFFELGQIGPLTLTCSTPAPGTNGTVTCTVSVPAGGSGTLYLSANVPSDTPPGTTFTNFVTVAGTNDPNDENNTGVAGTSTPPPPQADLSVTKSVPASAAPDTDVAFTITVTNSGPDDAQTVHMTDTIPGNMTFVSIGQSGAAFSCSTPAAGAGGAIDCSTATLAAGASTTFTLTVHVPSGTPSGTEYTNTASVTTATTDPNNENNSSTSGTTVVTSDVSVVKSAPAAANAGSNIDYIVTITNNGPDPTDGASFDDALTSTITFVSLTQNNGPAASCSTPAAGSSGPIECSTALTPTQSAQFTITVNIKPSVVNGTVITNTAIASSITSDTNTSNNTSSASTTVTSSADLSIVKTAPATVSAGSNMTYSITVANNGLSDAANVSISDPLPSGVTFVSKSQSGSPAFNCSGTTTITCTTASLPSGASVTLSIVVATSSGLTNGTTLSNTATVSTTSIDSNSANNTSTASTTANTSAEVSITKSGAAAVAAGSNITYTITVANAGPSDAASVSWNDTLPAGTTFVSLNQNSGPAFVCTTGATNNCSIASLISGASATFTLVAQVNGATPNGTTLSNTANVNSTTSDPNPANNSSTSSATVSANADLVVTKSGPSTPTAIGFDITYTISLHNNGPNDAFNVSLTDTLPPNTSFASFNQTSGPAFSCSGTSTITCTAASFASGATAAFTLVVHNSATAGTTVTNTATATAATPDPNPANNSGSASVPVLAQIPTLSAGMLMLLAIALVAVGWLVMRH